MGNSNCLITTLLVVVLLIFFFSFLHLNYPDIVSFRVEQVYSGGASDDVGQLYPQVGDSQNSMFKLFTGLDIPSGELTMPDLAGASPLSSIMPHMGNLTLRRQLGRAAWHLIHTMANTYPKNPTRGEKFAIVSFIRLFGLLYPCGKCAENFREKLKIHPPEPHTNSRDDLALYLCRIHNKVNVKLYKPIFDCSKITERWNCGCGRIEEPISLLPTAGTGTDTSTSAPNTTHSPTSVGATDDGEEDETLLLADGSRRKMHPIEKGMKMERRSLFEVDYQVYVKRLLNKAAGKGEANSKFSTI